MWRAISSRKSHIELTLFFRRTHVILSSNPRYSFVEPTFNKVKLRYSFLASAELAEGAVNARFFFVSLYKGNTRVKEFVKHMAHSDLEVG